MLIVKLIISLPNSELFLLLLIFLLLVCIHLPLGQRIRQQHQDQQRYQQQCHHQHHHSLKLFRERLSRGGEAFLVAITLFGEIMQQGIRRLHCQHQHQHYHHCQHHHYQHQHYQHHSLLGHRLAHLIQRALYLLLLPLIFLLLCL